MRGHSLRVVTWLLTSVVLACAPAPSPSPAPTQPPVPAAFVPWPDIVWTTAALPAAPASATGERVTAVAASAKGFVAVGFREEGDGRNGVAWVSTDGTHWTVAPTAPFAGVELVDVAASPAGYVALGATSPDADQPTAVVFGSADGTTWQRLEPLQATGETDPASIAGSAAGVLALGSDVSGAVAVWRSGDGRTFERVSTSSPAADGLIDPQVVDSGYVAVGTMDGAPALLRSANGTIWSGSAIDPRTDADANSVVAGRWGMVVQGSITPECDATSDACVPTDVAWWSLDGQRWAVLPTTGDSPLVNGVSLLVPAGDHGLLAIDGADAWSSPDGWAWRPMPEPGDGSVDVDDAVVRGDRIIAVGTQPSDVDDSFVGRILVGGPPS